MIARTWAELKNLSEDELIAEHDDLAGHTDVGLNFYLEELRYRHHGACCLQARRFYEVDSLADRRRHVGDSRQCCGRDSAFARLGRDSAFARLVMTAGIAAPAGDSAPRLRLKRLVGPKGSFRRVRRPHNMNDNILYHA